MTGKRKKVVRPRFKDERVMVVERIELVGGTSDTFDENAPAIEDVLAAIASEVPDAEWERVPTDLSENLDHYLYGAPKR
jgi:hypothetical protein